MDQDEDTDNVTTFAEFREKKTINLPKRTFGKMLNTSLETIIALRILLSVSVCCYFVIFQNQYSFRQSTTYCKKESNKIGKQIRFMIFKTGSCERISGYRVEQPLEMGTESESGYIFRIRISI